MQCDTGLSSDAIVARMNASAAWPAFYALFVVAAAIHAPLGLRAVVDEWLGLQGTIVDAALGLFALLLLGSGLYAVHALTG
jgi:fumarate reductase subunit C